MMFFQLFKTLLSRVVLLLSIVVALLMIATGYSGLVNPESCALWSVSGLLFPFFVLLDIVFVFLCLVVRRRYAIIPLLSLLVCYGPIRSYVPFNFTKEPPKDALTILSYNVYRYAGWDYLKKKHNPIVDYIAHSGADIVCLQESATRDYDSLLIDPVLNPVYEYRDTMMKKIDGEQLTLYSHYPIISGERIEYESKGNMSMANELLVEGDTVLVVNNHLETNGLSRDDKKKFQDMVKGEQDKNLELAILGKLKEAAQKRGHEAAAVAEYIQRYRERHPYRSVIVCGDFNDTPISWAYRTVAKGLQDCYVNAGNGPGYTYERHTIHVRIDHILCSKDFEVYECKVDKQISASDHYPVLCKVKKRAKP